MTHNTLINNKFVTATQLLSQYCNTNSFHGAYQCSPFFTTIIKQQNIYSFVLFKLSYICQNFLIEHTVKSRLQPCALALVKICDNTVIHSLMVLERLHIIFIVLAQLYATHRSFTAIIYGRKCNHKLRPQSHT